MTKAWIYGLAAITAYLAAGWNPAITFSKAIYKKDIRTCGSGNPGFTNFLRTFGGKWAWAVFVIDLSKAAVVAFLFALQIEKQGGSYALGAAYTGSFALLGHAYPVWYRFKGGKGFLVCLSTVWVIDFRVGLLATAIMVMLLFTTKYMSLSTVTSLLISPAMLYAFQTPIPAVLLCGASVLFVAIRHRENFKRLYHGVEPKFALRGRSGK